MALVDYKKYQVLINSDSKKVQGLQTGDIIRRQYFDGNNIIYSLMCVLSYGVERLKNKATGLYDERPYFIGALLEGDELDGNNKREILDFARVTNLFNVDRSGALYLTASDDQSPFMDVIDGIGKNKSLSWPENIASEAFEDSQTQYIVKGCENLNQQYAKQIVDSNRAIHHRVLTVTRMNTVGDSFEGIQQDFYQFVRNGNQVLISYKIRASKDMESIPVVLGYSDNLHCDAEWIEGVTTSWEYKFRIVTIEYSGRHLRSFKLDMSGLEVGEEIQIADFNIILLSSVANFGDGSVSRVGKLDGVVDRVFGQLTGYGAYLQKLYASTSAHISGTLTAGDENGFGATFYAGKIHRNCFINSLAPNCTHSIHIEDDKSEVVNPTGIGYVYRTSESMEIETQTAAWQKDNTDIRYCFSFWVYMKQPGRIAIAQNGKGVGEIIIDPDQTHEWRRVHICFNILPCEENSDKMLLTLTPTFTKSEYEAVVPGASNPNQKIMYFTAPQLESGEVVTQYQATDETLNFTEEYGAWFSRGGIGGTMQNPLLQLNYKDESGREGGIGTRSKSFLLRQDGSGYLANENISWNEQGKVTFGSDVTLNWENISKDAQDEIANRYCRILGDDTFTIIGYNAEAPVSPSSITLTIEEVGFKSTSAQRQWMYMKEGNWHVIPDANAKTLVITPDSELWGRDGNGNGGESTLTIQCVITLNNTRTYTDTKTIRKQYVQGYSVEVVSSSGRSFKNGTCSTTLTANVYYQGSLVDEEYAKANYQFIWHRYRASDKAELKLTGTTSKTSPHIRELNYELDGSELWVCELTTLDAFDYSFPIIF